MDHFNPHNPPDITPENSIPSQEPLPMVIATRRGDAVTIILGKKHITKTGEYTKELYSAAMAYSITKNQDTLDVLEDLLFPHKRYLRTGELSESKGGEVYFSGTEIPIPADLAEQLFEFLDNGWPVESLKNFWYRAMLNPSEHGRDGFFKYCKEYGVTITPKGYALLYKAVETKVELSPELDLARLVGEYYLMLIQNGTDPKEFIVVQQNVETSLQDDDDDDECSEIISYSIHPPGEAFIGTPIGTLNEMFTQIPELAKHKPTTVFTDKYSKSMDIRLGIPCVKNREQCDPDINQGCSYGLHVGSFSYVSGFANANDTVFACLVDPANVVALPTHDNSKIRVCEYMPYAVMNRDSEDGHWTEIESTFFENDYEIHDKLTLQTRFDTLSEKLRKDLDPNNNILITKQISVVRSRLSMLSHVVIDENTVDITTAPDDFTEFDQNNPQSPQNTFLYTEDPIDRVETEVTEEEEMMKEWSIQRRSGNTDLDYVSWTDQYDKDESCYSS